MSNMSVSAKSATPFEKLASSTPAKFVKDNAALAGAATLASGVILKNVADHSELASTVIKKGAIPLIGGGAALLGASMIHDAVQGSDDKSTLTKVGEGAGGAALAIAGTEVAARSFGASPLRALGKALNNPVGMATVYALPGIGATAWGVSNMKKEGLNLGNAAATGLGATWATAQTLLVANSYDMQLASKVAEKSLGVVGGASLGLGAAALGKKAYESVQDKNWTAAALYTGGSTVAGVASAHILGNATGIEALSNIAGKAFKNPILAGSIAVVGLTGVAYVAYSHDKAAEAKK